MSDKKKKKDNASSSSSSAASTSSSYKPFDGKKLKSVYDHVDSANYKQALKELKSVIDKNPDAVLPKIIKAICLSNTGKMFEATGIAKECATALIVSGKLGKEETRAEVFSLCTAFRSVDCWEDACTLLDKCWTENAADLEFGETLFFFQHRLGHHQKQQMTALKLYKQTNSSSHKYSLWAAAAGAMQDTPASLALAEKLVLKVADQMTTQEDVLLYADILLRLGRYEDCLQLIAAKDAKFSKLLKDETQLLVLRAYCNEKLERWDAAFEIYATLVTDHSHDNWAYLMGALQNLIRRTVAVTVASSPSPSPSSSLSLDVKQELSIYEQFTTLDELTDAKSSVSGVFLSMVRQLQSSNPKSHGLWLSEMELLRRIALFASDKEEYTRTIDFLQSRTLDYFARFGGIPICSEDIKPFLPYLFGPSFSPFTAINTADTASANSALIGRHRVSEFSVDQSLEKRRQFIDLLEKQIPSISAIDDKSKIQTVQYQITLAQLSTWLCVDIDPSASNDAVLSSLVNRAASYLSQYHSACEVIKTFEVGPDVTEMGLGDMFLYLAASLLMWAAYNCTNAALGRMALLYRAMAMLDLGLQRASNSFQLRLLYMEITSRIGLSPLNGRSWNELDIKNILFETASHLVLHDSVLLWSQQEKVAPLAMWGYGNTLQDVDRYHHATLRETSEFIGGAFKAGSYSKLREYQELQRRMTLSHIYAVSLVERSLTAVLDHTASMLDFKSFVVEYLRDNTDLLGLETRVTDLQSTSDYSAPWQSMPFTFWCAKGTGTAAAATSSSATSTGGGGIENRPAWNSACFGFPILRAPTEINTDCWYSTLLAGPEQCTLISPRDLPNDIQLKLLRLRLSLFSAATTMSADSPAQDTSSSSSPSSSSSSSKNTLFSDHAKQFSACVTDLLATAAEKHETDVSSRRVSNDMSCWRPHAHLQRTWSITSRLLSITDNIRTVIASNSVVVDTPASDATAKPSTSSENTAATDLNRSLEDLGAEFTGLLECITSEISAFSETNPIISEATLHALSQMTREVVPLFTLAANIWSEVLPKRTKKNKSSSSELLTIRVNAWGVLTKAADTLSGLIKQVTTIITTMNSEGAAYIATQMTRSGEELSKDVAALDKVFVTTSSSKSLFSGIATSAAKSYSVTLTMLIDELGDRLKALNAVIAAA